jgi:hypothetical protein
MHDFSCFGDGVVAALAAGAMGARGAGAALDRSLETTTTVVYGGRAVVAQGAPNQGHLGLDLDVGG